jgi:hypothetical protein
VFVDLLRFVAAVQMLQGHTVAALLAPAHRSGAAYLFYHRRPRAHLLQVIEILSVRLFGRRRTRVPAVASFGDPLEVGERAEQTPFLTVAAITLVRAIREWHRSSVARLSHLLAGTLASALESKCLRTACRDDSPAAETTG